MGLSHILKRVDHVLPAHPSLGVKQVYAGRYEPEKLLRLIQDEKVTFSHCVPTILQMLVNGPTIQEVDLSRWKVAIGGARLSRGLAQAALKPENAN